jgi:type IV pilus assembly protein PilC
MPIFIYKARNRSGKKIRGDLDASSLDVAEKIIKRKGFSDIKVKPKPRDLLEGTFLEGSVTSRDMMVFSRQFSTLINAGVPILQSLQVMCQQTENGKLRRKLYQITNDIEGGASLYESMNKHKDVFDDLYVNMVDAGETGGVLDLVLDRLARYIEKAAKLKSRVKSAMIYPGVIIAVSVIVIAIILIFVIPGFEDMFADFGESLPVPTQMAIDLSRFFKSNFLYVICSLAAAGIAFRLFYRWERGKILADHWVLFLPVVGPLLRKAAVARFSRTLSTMISSGVPILSALDIVSRTSGNKTVELGVLEAKKSISEGQTLAQPLEETGIFPPMVIHMISIGETTGTLDNMLGKVADFYDDEVDVAVESLTSLVEPIMIGVLGVIVGGLVVSMYLPIFQLGDVM